MNYLQSWFRRWAPWVERYLFGAALAAGVLLVISQLIMTNANARYRLNRAESLEGEPYRWSEETALSAAHENALEGVYWVELELRRGEGPLEVLRNGAAVAVLQSTGVVVYVNPGDILEIRGEIAREEPAVVEVISTHGLSSPRVGIQVTTYGDYDLIGWAVPRNGE